MFYAVIERPDGTTYTQMYREFEELQNLLDTLFPDYWIVDIYD